MTKFTLTPGFGLVNGCVGQLRSAGPGALLSANLYIKLLKAPFLATTEDVKIDAGTEADFGSYAPILSPTATRTFRVDEFNADRYILIPPPVGGWVWSWGPLPSVTPNVIYGFLLTPSNPVTAIENSQRYLYGRFDQPIQMRAAGDTLRIGTVEVTLKARAFG